MTRDDCLHALQSNNVQALLRLIRQGESSQNDDAYRTLFGGELFDGFADHPRKVVTRNGLRSSAAGAYQFLQRTWDGVVLALGPMDFSAPNQDIGAVFLIARRKALDDVIAGRINEAIRKCATEWASLPGSSYGQPTQKLAKALEVYAAYGGQTAAPQTQPKAEVKAMPAALIPVILQGLVGLIPQLGSLFGGTSEVAQRNVAAATIVAQKITEVTGAVNLQDAAEKIQSDPQILQAARDAVAQIWPEITETGSGGIDGARKANLAPDQPKPWFDKAVIIAFMFTPLIYIVVLASIGKWEYIGDITSETRAQVIGTVLGVLFGGIVGYFYGTSAGSQRKTDVLAAR